MSRAAIVAVMLLAAGCPTDRSAGPPMISETEACAQIISKACELRFETELETRSDCYHQSSEHYCRGKGKRQIEIAPEQISRCALAMAAFKDRGDPDCALVFGAGGR